MDKDVDENLAPRLLHRLESRSARLGIIGMGYVGLPLALAAGRAGFRVTGFDIDQAKVEAINAGRSPIRSIAGEKVAKAKEEERLRATLDFDALTEMDVIIICVPTPLTRHRNPDLSFIENTGQAIASRLRRGQLVVLESTTYPGTTEEVLKPLLEKSGLKTGTDYYLAYSPEREDPGKPDFETSTIPRVVGSDDPTTAELAVALYSAVVGKVVLVSSAATAEAVKLTENIFRAVNIALVNELKVVYRHMGIDIWEVIDAAKSKPFGFMPFYPGPGLGGHCIPIDPFYLTWKAREFSVPTRFIELAGEVNSDAPRLVIASLIEALSSKARCSLNGARILLLGIAYKKNVDDLRESPSLAILEMLEERGADVEFYDPFIPVIPQTREHALLAGRESVGWSQAVVAGFDAVLICTDHDNVDYDQLAEWSKLIVDTRNATRAVRKHREKISLA